MAEKKQGTTPKQKIPFDWKRCAIASLPFMGMISFWQVFDGLVPKMLTLPRPLVSPTGSPAL